MVNTLEPFARRPRRAVGAMLAACLLVLPANAVAQEPTPTGQVARMASESEALRHFYALRAERPLWLAEGRLTPAARALIGLIDTAGLDEIEPGDVFASELHDALARAEAQATPEALAAADRALSRSFAAYVRLTREAPDGVMLYEHVSLQPQQPGAFAALQDAAQATSLEDHVRRMAWLHPLYAPMRRAYAEAGGAQSSLRTAFRHNLERLRGLPAVPPGGRYVLVNAAAARLWMYEGTKVADTMKVVVGRTDHQTPMMAGYIRYAILNPYWNLPADFTRDRLAARVLDRGVSYLRKGGYEVMSDWSAEAVPVDPATIDWRAIAAGASDLRVRQLPGAANSMGKVKFEFPNQLGIYLHDTPEQELMSKDARLYSSGCVRLEDAQRLGRWLFGGAMPQAAESEHRVDLPGIVPVYVTYLTLQPRDDGGVVVLGDPYGRDGGAEPAFAAQSGEGGRPRGENRPAS